jgi:hypothetical protein
VRFALLRASERQEMGRPHRTPRLAAQPLQILKSFSSSSSIRRSIAGTDTGWKPMLLYAVWSVATGSRRWFPHELESSLDAQESNVA